MEIIENLINLLPKLEEIIEISRKDSEARFILQKCIKILELHPFSIERNADELEESTFLIQALIDRSWERIHTGHFSEVPLEIRQIYALGCYFKILFLLLESSDRGQIEKCSEILDEAILIGCTDNLYPKCKEFKQFLMEIFDKKLDASQEIKLPIIENPTRRFVKCDVLQLNRPSVEEFNKKCFEPQQPALLLNILNDWPALRKWHDLNYILKLAGNRTVPIEIGSNYATEEWSQQLMKIKDFLRRQFAKTEDENCDIEYLAQHELFEQIPQLKKDFSIPDYCSLGKNMEPVDIKAWLGPKGTISPMHYDPKHNLLCQVFGSKFIILASPKDSENLYPYESEFLKNTAQIDANSLDLDQFPLAANVTFYKLTLQKGDCLYIPPKFWHYVQSESPSFSVSFWWE